MTADPAGTERRASRPEPRQANQDRVGEQIDSPVRRRLVAPLPAPGEVLVAVLTGWELIDQGEQPYSVNLARPWEPATCTDALLRAELWAWLDQVVHWVNHEHLWDPSDLIPPCWPQHPHLVHELAVLAVERRQASRTTTPDALQQWQTHTLPTFLTRTHTRLKRHCDTDHQPTPATTAHARYQAHPQATARKASFDNDLTAAAAEA